MPTKRLCILECDFVLENTVHRFPNEKTDKERRKKWLELINVDEPIVKYIYLCSNHFSRKQYHGTLLNRDALPDINLHKCTFGNEENIRKPKEFPEPPEGEGEEGDGDKNIRTIRVHKDLYDRIVKAGFMDLGDKSGEKKQKKDNLITTIATQTEPSNGFCCSIIEFSFITHSYMIHCFFCDKSFHLHQFIKFQEHMVQEHRGFRDSYSQYTLCNKRKLFEVRNKSIPTPNLTPIALKVLNEKLLKNSKLRSHEGKQSNKRLKSVSIGGNGLVDPLSGTNGDCKEETNLSDNEEDKSREEKKLAKKDRTTKMDGLFENIASKMLDEILNESSNEEYLDEEPANETKKTFEAHPYKTAKTAFDEAEMNMDDTIHLSHHTNHLEYPLPDNGKIGFDPNSSSSVYSTGHLVESNTSHKKAVLREVSNKTQLTIGADMEKNKIFYRNLKISSNEDPLCCSDVYSSDDEYPDRKQNKDYSDNEIRLSCTPSAIVCHFLDLMKANTVVCFDRTRYPERYDLAVSNIIVELTLAHRITLTSLEVRRSINRIKNWFTHTLRKSETQLKNPRRFMLLPYPPAYEKYFQKCIEFLPPTNLPSKWYTTQAIYTGKESDRDGIKIGFECEFCKIYFQTPSLYTDHMTNEHRKCKVCSLLLPTEKSYSEHLKLHLKASESKAQKYSCKHCNREFPLKNMLRAHMARFCIKSAGSGRPLSTGTVIRYKNGKAVKVFPCRTCDKTFEVSHMRRWHELKHDGPQYKCDLCPKAFYTKFPLTQHYRSHKNVRDYICDICGKAYCSYKNLYCHQQTVHFRTKKFVCDLCGIDVTNNCNLARHKRIVHSQLEKGTYIEYKCRRKGKEYLCRKRIKSRRARPQKYKCKLCITAYSTYKELLDHKREKHLCNKAVKCNICGRMIGEIYLNRHMKQVHKFDNNEEESTTSFNDGNNVNEEHNLNEQEPQIDVTDNDDVDFIIEDYNDGQENNDFNGFVENYLNDPNNDEVHRAVNEIENEDESSNKIDVTEEDLAYLVLNSCS